MFSLQGSRIYNYIYGNGLWWILHGQVNTSRVDGDLQHVAKSTVSKVLTAVINVLISPAIIRQFIYFPTTPADLDMQVQEFGGVAGFPKVVGVVDGTYIRVIATSSEEEVFVNRKGYRSINVQVDIISMCLLFII